MREFDDSDTERSRVQSLVRPEVMALPHYDPGADPDTVALRYGLKRVIKLSNNENPYGMSPLAVQALQQRLGLGLGRYPDPAGRHLCRVLAEHHGTQPDHIVLGNGSENILELLCQAFIQPGELVLTQQPCFSLHETFPLMMGAQVRKVPLTDTFACDVAAWRAALAQRPKMVLMSTPCNPVGSVFSDAELQAIIDATPPDCLLVIDEAYFEYAAAEPGYANALLVLQHAQRPWIVLRTFSKAYGLASLRVGYGIASHASVIEALHRVRTPYNVNQLAQEAAIAALQDLQHLETSVALARAERTRLQAALGQAGVRVAPSLANFLFIDTAMDATQVVHQLLQAGVIVKAWREPGYQTFIRASLALPADNDIFLSALLRTLKRR